MSSGQRNALRQERFNELVRFARENSPFYAEHYRNVADSFEYTDLPPVCKSELMAHWDNWVTDRDVKLKDVVTFMQNKDHIGRKLKGKYMVFTTSGSTGNPLIALYDKPANNMMSAISAMRSFARKEDLKEFIRRGSKTMGIFATNGFYLSNGSVRARQLSMPWKKRQMAVTSALLPVGDIVRQLNSFQPAMLGGYPSSLELLIDEAKAGRLKNIPRSHYDRRGISFGRASKRACRRFRLLCPNFLFLYRRRHCCM
ncbi:MAG: hypothetical protein ABFD11_11090 [Christensenella sp.]